MTKRVFRYFFDFTDGQEVWLNEMATEGWRLIRCGQLTYYFESCTQGEYEYAVEFVADKSYAKSKDYKAFLESMGYKTFYKNINVGLHIGKAEWRPWGEGAGQIATAPGSFQKELIILEKKKDGKPFELHTDLTDSLAKQRKIFIVYLWSIISMFALSVMCAVFTVIASPYLAILSLICAAFGILWLTPALKLVPKIRKLVEEAETNEYEAESMKKRVLKIIATAVVPVVIISVVFGVLHFSGVPVNSYSARNMVQTSWGRYWNASYSRLNGFKQRHVSLNEGMYTFAVEITTKSGSINLSIIGQDGKEYFKGSELQTSTFNIQVDIAANDKLTLRVDAVEHSGGYKISWDSTTSSDETARMQSQSPFQTSARIYLYGEQHGVEKILERELEKWHEYYHNESMRHLFVELPYYTAEFLNLWMKADDDDILEAVYEDWEGTLSYNPHTLVFYQRIKSGYPETVFHGTDVGHQYDTTGKRFIKHLEENDMKASGQYALTQEAIEQGRYYYEHSDDVYRENKMTENFIREFDELKSESIMGIYGGAHTGLDAMDYSTNTVPCMAKQLMQRYGEVVSSEDLAWLAKDIDSYRVDTIDVNGKDYKASYFGKQAMYCPMTITRC